MKRELEPTERADDQKVIGHRTAAAGGLEAAAGFLRLVIALRQGKPFIPRGVHRFTSFEECQSWSMKMMARPSSPDRQPSKTSSASAPD